MLYASGAVMDNLMASRVLWLLLAVAACSTEDPGTKPSAAAAAGRGAAVIPADWVRIETRCNFAFSAPPGWKEINQQGQDSCVTAYETPECFYSGDRGPYGGSFSTLRGEANYTERSTTINGYEATIASFGPSSRPRPFFTAVHFTKGPKGLGDQLSVTAVCNSLEAAREAEATFPTITFK